MRKGRRGENFIPWLIPVTLEHFTAVTDAFRLEQLHLSGGPGFSGGGRCLLVSAAALYSLAIVKSGLVLLMFHCDLWDLERFTPIFLQP